MASPGQSLNTVHEILQLAPKSWRGLRSYLDQRLGMHTVSLLFSQSQLMLWKLNKPSINSESNLVQHLMRQCVNCTVDALQEQNSLNVRIVKRGPLLSSQGLTFCFVRTGTFYRASSDLIVKSMPSTCFYTDGIGYPINTKCARHMHCNMRLSNYTNFLTSMTFRGSCPRAISQGLAK